MKYASVCQRGRILPWLLGLTLASWVGWGPSPVAADPFRLEFPAPTLDRWMYPFNLTPGTRVAAPVFGTFGDESGVDTRHGQFLLGWDTAELLPTNQPAGRYVVTEVRLALTTLREFSFLNDSTADAFETYLNTNDLAYVPDVDPGRPVELFGAGFRNGFTVETFEEASPFGSERPGERNAFAAGFNEHGELVDVGNNLGKTNESFLPFPSRPFGIGVIDRVMPGEPVPAGSTVTFSLQLDDPMVRGYVQEALSTGRLRLMVTWLGESEGLGGGPNYPDFATKENLIFDPPSLEIEGVLIGEADTDEDGLPDDWERLYFTDLSQTGEGDFDEDGQSNRDEFEFGTDPTNAASRVALQTLTQESDGRVRLEFVADAPGPLVIEVSEELRQWSEVAGEFTFPGITTGRWESSEPAPDTAAFYRIRRATGE